MPTVKVAFLCKGAQLHKTTGALSIDTIFDEYTVPQGENTSVFGLIVFWGGKTGEYFKTSATIIDNKGNILADTPPQKVTISKQPYVTSITEITAAFSEPGRFSVNVNVGGICVDTVPISISKL